VGKKSSGETIFAFIILLLFSLFVYFALGYKPQVRIVPLVVAMPALLLALWQFYLTFRAEQVKAKRDDEEAAVPAKKNILVIWLWLVFLVATAYIIGMLAASFVFLFCFLRFFSFKSWRLSAVVSVLFFSVIYLLFHVILEKL